MNIDELTQVKLDTLLDIMELEERAHKERMNNLSKQVTKLLRNLT